MRVGISTLAFDFAAHGWRQLRLFNYSPVTAFQLELSLLLMSRSAQPNFSSCPFFSFTSLFRLFSPHVCLPFMPQTFHPLLHPTTVTTTHPHPPIPLFTSLPISRYQALLGPDKLRVCLSSFSRLLPPALPNLAPPSLSHHTIPSHVGETCRHPSATFDHCFYWDPSLPCSALGWQRRQRGKE